MDADWSISATISMAAVVVASILLATSLNRRVDLSRVDLGVAAVTLATRFLIRVGLAVAVWLAVVYLVGLLRIALMRL